MKFKNEKTFDYHVHELLKKKYKEEDGFIIEAESSTNQQIQKILNNSSKSGTGNIGKPEFIIWNPKWPEFCIVVEDKNKTKNHNNSINEAIWYGIKLSESFHVFAMGVTALDDGLPLFQTAMFIKNKKGYFDLQKTEKPISWNLLLNNFDKETSKSVINESELIKISKWINQSLRDNLALPELKRPIFVSIILICLTDDVFLSTYTWYLNTPELVNFIYSCFIRILQRNNLHHEKINIISNTSSFIKNIKGREDDPSTLMKIIDTLRHKVINDFNIIEFDVVGHFYESFIKFSTNGGGDLGINLTPNHIAKLMYSLVNGGFDDILLDPTMGTGTFLSVHWKNIYKKYKNSDEITLKNLQHSSTIGIELDDNMYTLSLMNMILHHDGFNNLFMGNCFDNSIRNSVKKLNPTKLLMNPPYGQKENELNFTIKALDLLQKGGTAAVIFPLSILRNSPESNLLKKQLFEKNTIIASIEMPKEIFQTVSTHTCILVLRAGVPHDYEKEVWFAKFDDKYKTYNKAGRLPTADSNPHIAEFINNYFSKNETDYSFLKRINSYEDHFIYSNFINKFTSPNEIYNEIFDIGIKFLLKNLAENNWNFEQNKLRLQKLNKIKKEYKTFNVNDLFIIKKGKRWKSSDRIYSIGDFPFVTATNGNNGVAELVNKNDVPIIFDKGCITINVFGKAFVQEDDFSADDNVTVLIPKKTMSKKEKIFYISALKYLRVIHNFGYKLQNVDTINKINFNLPIDENGNIDTFFIEKTVDDIIKNLE